MADKPESPAEQSEQTGSLRPLLISAEVVADLLGVARRSVYRWDASGKLPMPIKIGGALRWRREELEDWVRSGCPPRTKWKWDREK